MMPNASDPIVPIPPATVLSYEQSSALMLDTTFRGRVKTSCLKFANSIMDEAATEPYHNTRLRWAASCMQNPDATSMQVQPPTVMDGAVQTAGSDITDNALQGSVEAVVKKML